MSDNVLIFIPRQPDFVPSPERLAQAVHWLRDRYGGSDGVEGRVNDAIGFVDCGQNLEAVRCPGCGSDIEMGWWSDQMERSFKGGFVDRMITTPCCNLRADLNGLTYHWPAGFGRCQIQVKNPRRSVEEQEVSELESALGCALRVIQAHI